jgi:hypothetical protein
VTLDRPSAAVAALALAAGALALGRPRSPAAAAPAGGPRDTTRAEYVSSAACRSCHPAEHATWHRSFHRTMTQRALAATVRADVGGAPLELDGRVYTLARRGSEVWATMPDLDALADAERRGVPASVADAPTVERPLLLTTGSHHYQGYWVSGRRGGELRMLPFVWLVREGKWYPRRDVFLQPPGAPQHFVRWNSNCVQCHSVAGQPGHDPSGDRFDTEAAELGVACEACHGPGGAHVARYRSPAARYARHGRDEADPTIVNPKRLSAERASALCGQCHALAYPRDEAEWWRSGYTRRFRPGDPLAPSRILLARSSLGDPAAPAVDADVESLFWSDGTIRVGGREHSAMVLSACFAKGEGARKMSCLSCHAMHAGDPAGQIAPERAGDAGCVQCHASIGAKAATHTHHAARSSGSRCVACHMPRDAYALLKGIRSHRVDSPRVRVARDTGRLLACNACHLDKSLGWARDLLAAWYGAERPELDRRAENEPAAALAATRGDAAQRALAAWAMGDDEALVASGRSWQVPYLDALTRDPYAAVRLIAGRSRGAHPARDVTPAERERVHAMVAERDDREVTIAE